MPVQMVCDSTSLVSAALRDSLATSGSSSGIGSGSSAGGGPSSSSSLFANSSHTSGFLEPADDDDIDRIENTLTTAIKRNQLRPVRYEEVSNHGYELDHLKSKYTMLKTTSNSSSNGINGGIGGSAGLPGVNGNTTNTNANGTGLLMNGGNKSAAVTGSDSSNGGGGNAISHQNGSSPASSSGNTSGAGGGKDQLPVPKRVLYSRENVQLGWKATGRKWATGAGMVNVGNTCYLNSTLQALFHVPAIANWLISDSGHRERCDDNNGQGGGCIICAMAKTLIASQTNPGAIKPFMVYSKLRLVCKHLVLGRQEDAHEFLRYLVEAMEKSYLGRFKNSKELDQYSKETTPLNQILGGYLRSEVKCLSCQHISTTFQHFEDLLLDIRKASSIEEALEVYFSLERLEENQYKCEACKKRVAATKQFSLERAPFALCIQLKRFSMLGGKINKHVELRNRLDLTPYSKSGSSSGKLTYKLVSMVTHLGNSQHCGHYTAIGNTESGTYYVFDDSSVRPISIQNVTSTNAYIIFYELESVQNGMKTNASSTATLASYASGLAGSSPSGKQLGSNGPGSSGTSSNASPLRAAGSSVNSGHNPLLPSKLENRPNFIGPMLPQSSSEKTKKLANGMNTHIHFKDNDDYGEPVGTSRLSPVSSTASSLSNPSPIKFSLNSPKKNPTINSSGSSPGMKNKFSMTITGSSNGLSSNAVNTGTGAGSSSSNGSFKSSFTPSYSSPLASTSSASILPSMPKLCNSPAAAKNSASGTGNSETSGISSNHHQHAASVSINGHSSASKAFRLVPYDDDDENDDNHDSRQHTTNVQNGRAKMKNDDNDEDGERVYQSGKKLTAKPEEEDSSSCSPKSPPVIKTKAGLWKVSDNRPSSSSSSSANSSNNASPATSGGSSPSNYNHTTNAATTNGGGPLASGYQTNGRQQQYQQYQNQSSNAFNGFGNSHNNGNHRGGNDVVQQLQKYSHRGYGAPVRSWNGQQANMERELANERREDRKRQMEDDRDTEMDRGRSKKVKTHFYSGNNQNQGNLFQNYQNHQMNGGGNNNNGRKWINNNNGGYNNKYGNHFQNRGGGYYQNGGGNHPRNHNGFRNGRHGRSGFFNKSHHHNQRGDLSGGNSFHNR